MSKLSVDTRVVPRTKRKLLEHDGNHWPKNVLGTSLQLCCHSPATGFFRDGRCRTGALDEGVHTVCALMTEEFLDFSQRAGNDLTNAVPRLHFPGLKPGDRWCLCAARWREALEAGAAPPVVLEATHERTLEFVSLKELKAHAVLLPQPKPVQENTVSLPSRPQESL